MVFSNALVAQHHYLGLVSPLAGLAPHFSLYWSTWIPPPFFINHVQGAITWVSFRQGIDLISSCLCFCSTNKKSWHSITIGIDLPFFVQETQAVVLHLQVPSRQSFIAVVIGYKPLQWPMVYMHCKAGLVQVKTEMLCKVNHDKPFFLYRCIL